MHYLMKELSNLFLTRKDVCEFLENNNKINDLELDCLDSKSLQLDENDGFRLPILYRAMILKSKGVGVTAGFNEKLCIFENDKIFVKKLLIKDFCEIKIVNTVIFGNVFIDADPEYRKFDKVEIYLENAIIFGSLTIGCYSKENTIVSIHQCAIDYLSLLGLDVFEYVSISFSTFGLIKTSVTINSFSCYYACIECFRKERGEIGKTDFSMTKIDWKKSLNFNMEDLKWTTIKPCLVQVNDEDLRNEKDFRNKQTKLYTIKFFKSLPAIFSLKDMIYLQFEEQNVGGTRISRFFSRIALLLGNPSKIIALMLAMILSFSIYFYFTNSNENFCFLNALRHSVITFTTVGYDDLSKADNSLWTIGSIIESFLGVCCSGAFLIALTRKYLDKKD